MIDSDQLLELSAITIREAFSICNFIAEKSTINIFYKESCTLVFGEFCSPLPPAPGGQRWRRGWDSQSSPFKLCAERLVPAATAPLTPLCQFQPGGSSAISISTVCASVGAKNWQHPALQPGKQGCSVGEISVVPTWEFDACENCPLIFTQQEGVVEIKYTQK
ncbi:hypothetical protein KIL84_016318 [Mauremys mutica]|uniref:Uncharacterized protein n=1 Tax=Mauremys mutica TaxID=74926 RepID=A0A9D4ASQ3_9SAUR|nr:hypothetical protein KIL84_016318 [Mauremys mutica]